ncbi:MAG: hypothetical protein NUW01_12215, partial [Gemmatimonadaceae bacterium]|nr:hypothetical protein [Gemmatimonadaceae bacterium]
MTKLKNNTLEDILNQQAGIDAPPEETVAQPVSVGPAEDAGGGSFLTKLTNQTRARISDLSAQKAEQSSRARIGSINDNTKYGQEPQQAQDWSNDPYGYFQSLIAGLSPTPQSLIGLEAQLGAQGIKVLRNARGVAGKIQLPNGQIVDVIQGADTGGVAWQWDLGGGSGGSDTPWW